MQNREPVFLPSSPITRDTRKQKKQESADPDYSESTDSSPVTSSEEEANEDRTPVPRKQLVELLTLLAKKKFLKMTDVLQVI